MTHFPFPEFDSGKGAEEFFPINLTRMMLHTQGLTPPYWKYAPGFRHSKISAQLHERVIVRVAAVADCEYQLVQHKSDALRIGTSRKLLADLTDKRHREFGAPALTARVGYVDSLATDTGAEPDSLKARRKYFPDDGSVDCAPADTDVKQRGL